MFLRFKATPCYYRQKSQYRNYFHSFITSTSHHLTRYASGLSLLVTYIISPVVPSYHLSKVTSIVLAGSFSRIASPGKTSFVVFLSKISNVVSVIRVIIAFFSFFYARQTIPPGVITRSTQALCLVSLLFFAVTTLHVLILPR